MTFMKVQSAETYRQRLGRDEPATFASSILRTRTTPSQTRWEELGYISFARTSHNDILLNDS